MMFHPVWWGNPPIWVTCVGRSVTASPRSSRVQDGDGPRAGGPADGSVLEGVAPAAADRQLVAGRGAEPAPLPTQCGPLRLDGTVHLVGAARAAVVHRSTL